jgi:hypothetical protein
MSKREIKITDANARQLALPPLDISAASMPQSDVEHTPNIPNLVTDLSQRPPFTQAPVGTKAQGTALHASLHLRRTQNGSFRLPLQRRAHFRSPGLPHRAIVTTADEAD